MGHAESERWDIWYVSISLGVSGISCIVDERVSLLYHRAGFQVYPMGISDSENFNHHARENYEPAMPLSPRRPLTSQEFRERSPIRPGLRRERRGDETELVDYRMY